MARAVAAILSIMLALTGASSQTRREDEPYCDHTSPNKVEINDGDARILGFAIGSTSLKDVQGKLGTAKAVRVSRDEESDISICYMSSTDGTFLVFYSGAMGGWMDLTSFALWSREAAFPHAAECVPSSLVSRNLATESGLRLGLAKEQVEMLAGKATAGSATSARYEYRCRRKMTAEEIKGFKTANNWDVTGDPYFDRMSWIDVRYKNSITSRIEVGRIESY